MQASPRLLRRACTPPPTKLAPRNLGEESRADLVKNASLLITAMKFLQRITMEKAMKTYTWLALCCGGLALAPVPSHAQRSLSATQLSAIVKTDLNGCSTDQAQPNAIIPLRDAKQFLARDGALNVDYYWVIDMKRHEALVVEQLSPNRSATETRKIVDAPSISFLACGEEGYVPRSPRQVHSFTKVSDNIEDARSVLVASTGLKVEDNKEFTLSSTWQQLVDTKYFDTAKFGAYAGGLFKPFEIGSVANAIGPAFASMRYEAEYRGGGATAARFTTGTPIKGVEDAQFLGVTSGGKDFLVASFGNGRAWRKVATEGGVMELAFDKVVIGPLAQ